MCMFSYITEAIIMLLVYMTLSHTYYISAYIYRNTILLSSVTIIMLLILRCAEQSLLKRRCIGYLIIAASYNVPGAIYRMTMNY